MRPAGKYSNNKVRTPAKHRAHQHHPNREQGNEGANGGGAGSEALGIDRKKKLQNEEGNRTQ